MTNVSRIQRRTNSINSYTIIVTHTYFKNVHRSYIVNPLDESRHSGWPIAVYNVIRFSNRGFFQRVFFFTKAEFDAFRT